MQFLGLCSRFESETPRVGTTICILTSPPGDSDVLKLKKYWPREWLASTLGSQPSSNQLLSSVDAASASWLGCFLLIKAQWTPVCPMVVPPSNSPLIPHCLLIPVAVWYCPLSPLWWCHVAVGIKSKFLSLILKILQNMHQTFIFSLMSYLSSPLCILYPMVQEWLPVCYWFILSHVCAFDYAVVPFAWNCLHLSTCSC